MKAKSIRGGSTEEIKYALEQSMGDGFKPALAIVFLSIKQDHQAICQLLDRAGISVFGVSTNGEFIDEETHTGSVAMLLLDINKEYFTIIFDEYPDRDYREKAKAVAQKALKKFDHPAFLLSCSNTATDAEELL